MSGTKSLGAIPRRALCLGLLIACLCAERASAQADPKIGRIAADFRSHMIHDDPSVTYSSGLPPAENDRFADRSPAGLAAGVAWKRGMLDRLRRIAPETLAAQDQALYLVLKEQLEADLQLQVCRSELWNVNHFLGWQAQLAPVAEGQPVETAKDRAQALARWSSLPRFVAIEIANLDRGLASGYSAPKSVVRRVIRQLDTLLPSGAGPSPLLSPAERSQDAAFKAAYSQVAAHAIFPAIRRFHAYLETEYLPKAREGVALSDLPNGRACYQAELRAYTTLDRTPEQVFALGQKTVEANLAAIREIGQKRFGITDVAEIVRRLKADPASRFSSQDALLSYTRTIVADARDRTRKLITTLPGQDVVVTPERAADEAAGVSSHYDINGNPAEPATYRIQLGVWNTQTRGEAAIVAVHETWPGHHLQIAFAREHLPGNPLADLVGNSAYMEGWARYAEALAEEAGMYAGDDARVLRRIWPARGMVVDPGLHAMGWSRQQAIDYLVATGRYDARQADDTVDRIAVMPGQLTSYDSGGLEIMALRREAEAALGPRFDLPSFNQAVLELGVIPLTALRAHVRQWIERQGGAPSGR